jgi:hypothetical protein
MIKAPDRAKRSLASLFNALESEGWTPGHIVGWREAELTEHYNKLLDSRTTWPNLPFACVSYELLALNRPDTVRGNMYQVVSQPQGWLPDTGDKSYDKVQRLLNRLRMNGTIPFEWVVDTIRETIIPSTWKDLADYTKTVRHAYRKNLWAFLPEHVAIICEKDAIAGKIQAVTKEYGVPLHPNRGYDSTSFAWEVASDWKDIDKPIIAYYVGDWDPSGLDMERDCREKISELSGKEPSWTRLAFEEHHFEQFDIRPLKVKRNKKTGEPTDKRAPAFIKRYGDRCAEADAIPANALREMLRQAIKRHIPQKEWARLLAIENAEKKRWQQALDMVAKGGNGL